MCTCGAAVQGADTQLTGGKLFDLLSRSFLMLCFSCVSSLLRLLLWPSGSQDAISDIRRVKSRSLTFYKIELTGDVQRRCNRIPLPLWKQDSCFTNKNTIQIQQFFFFQALKILHKTLNEHLWCKKTLAHIWGTVSYLLNQRLPAQDGQTQGKKLTALQIYCSCRNTICRAKITSN